MDRKALSDIARKKRVFAYADKVGFIAKACRYFGISREAFYGWKRKYASKGEAGLTCPRKPSHLKVESVRLLFVTTRRAENA